MEISQNVAVVFAVLMIDFEPFEQLSSSAQLSYFMGATGSTDRFVL
jgi:hypothetical protein